MSYDTSLPQALCPPRIAAQTVFARHHRRQETTGAAFTLVELLVVIGIISLLVAILLPALNRASEAARSVACMSNLRQIGIAMAIYHEDSRGRMVPINWTGSNPHQTWRGFLLPYLGNNSVEVFRCPEKGEPGAHEVDAQIIRLVAPHSYGINQMPNLHYQGDGAIKASSNRRLNEVREPSATIVVGDLGFPSNPQASPEDWMGDRGKSSWGYMRMPSDPLYHHTADPWNLYPRHRGRVNVLFYDGHVESRAVTGDIAKYPPGHPLCIYDNF